MYILLQAIRYTYTHKSTYTHTRLCGLTSFVCNWNFITLIESKIKCNENQLKPVVAKFAKFRHKLAHKNNSALICQRMHCCQSNQRPPSWRWCVHLLTYIYIYWRVRLYILTSLCRRLFLICLLVLNHCCTSYEVVVYLFINNKLQYTMTNLLRLGLLGKSLNWL